jgi:serine O-acetyltransferase
MNSSEEHSFNLDELTRQIVRTYEDDSGINFIDVKNLPMRDRIVEILHYLYELLFPGYTGKRRIQKDTVGFTVQELLIIIRRELAEQIERALMHQCRQTECPTCNCAHIARRATEELLCRLPEIREMLKDDVKAAYRGDPAAGSFEEIVISYPFITAIAAHRIAHELYRMSIPLIPRIISEWAHSQTGIDIHPGARIGRHFFIDHGTGVVIGETAVIGSNVKIYQGVTLGAVSFPRNEKGEIIRGQKRHPTLEDDVTVYAEATILGDITIGKGAVIGGNVWIRQSVPPGGIVTIATPESLYVTRGRKKTTAEKEPHEPDTPR